MWTCECADLFLFHENGIALVFMLPFFFPRKVSDQKFMYGFVFYESDMNNKRDFYNET